METDTKPAIECTPTRWRILPEWSPKFGFEIGGINVEMKMNRRGETTYAVVCREMWELSKDGEWDAQPMPSSRTEKYLNEHRWSKVDDAIAAAQIAAERALSEYEAQG